MGIEFTIDFASFTIVWNYLLARVGGVVGVMKNVLSVFPSDIVALFGVSISICAVIGLIHVIRG